MKKIYLAGGCFWGIEHFLKLLLGVTETEVGYANSCFENPTYKDVSSGVTGAAETVEVVYDETTISLPRLLQLYFKTIDPIAHNRQGNDVGSQYRTGIYYMDEVDSMVIHHELQELQKQYPHDLIAVEVLPLDNFYPAELYHQDYLDKNPNGYCHISPELFELARNAHQESKTFLTKSKEELKQELTQLQYAVTQEAATEPPFFNIYDKEFREGIYVDITSGEPLFISADKYDAGCGWPAFSRPISDRLIAKFPDATKGRLRTEVKAAHSDAHLGHLFDDGPEELGGLRYCINSAALRFIPKEEMVQAGYTDYLYLLDKK